MANLEQRTAAEVTDELQNLLVNFDYTRKVARAF